MKGFVSIDIPTKPYIKAYVIHKLGPQLVIRNNADTISSKLYDLLQHGTDEFASRPTSKMYTSKLRLFIPVQTFRKRGANINVTNLKNFNLFIEAEIKHWFYFIMDEYMSIHPNFMQNLPDVRRKLGIDLEAWSDDSMKKDYYRYRIGKKRKAKISVLQMSHK
jgi:hypothetical protein